MKEIDPEIKPFLELCWANKIETQFSCCGHGAERPYIKIKSSKSLINLLNLFLSRSVKVDTFVHEIRAAGEDEWFVDFEALILIPAIYPSWTSDQEKWVSGELKKLWVGTKYGT